MAWLDLISYAFGGAFLSNAVPHFVSGMQGRAFQTPLARPPGQGLSTSTVNVLWGFANFVIAYVLLAQVGAFDFHAIADVVSLGIGILVIGLVAARGFGRFHGGNAPADL